ncbi:hypothetical protein MYA_4395 [Burkholderia sp. KJ006]|nr:hypothetical protein MYA_4395 [Burkholderia sp. KJ006]
MGHTAQAGPRRACVAERARSATSARRAKAPQTCAGLRTRCAITGCVIPRPAAARLGRVRRSATHDHHKASISLIFTFVLHARPGAS